MCVYACGCGCGCVGVGVGVCAIKKTVGNHGQAVSNSNATLTGISGFAGWREQFFHPLLGHPSVNKLHANVRSIWGRGERKTWDHCHQSRALEIPWGVPNLRKKRALAPKTEKGMSCNRHCWEQPPKMRLAKHEALPAHVTWFLAKTTPKWSGERCD